MLEMYRKNLEVTRNHYSGAQIFCRGGTRDKLGHGWSAVDQRVQDFDHLVTSK